MIGEDISNDTKSSVQTLISKLHHILAPVSLSAILSEKKNEYTELYCFQKMSILILL